MFAGIYIHALGDGDCGLDRLHPAAIRADTEYSSYYPVENLVDGNIGSYWQSQSGDTYDNVYLDFASTVDIKHIMIKEGYYVQRIYIYDATTGSQKSYIFCDSDTYQKVYNFWYHQWETEHIRIYFYGSQTSYLRIAEVSVWGCNVTNTTLPTAVPTVSPSQMPTNHTPTVMPTNLPSASPTELPTNAILSTLPTTIPSASPTDMPTTLPTVSPTPIPTLPSASPTDMPTHLPTSSPTQIPTQMLSQSPTKSPSYQPSLSPSMHPTTTLVPSSSPTMTPTSTLLPTSSPTLYPTFDIELSSDDGGIAGTTRTDGDTVISIGVLVTLIVLLFVMALSTLYFFCKLYRAKQQVGTLNTLAMTETYQQKDQL